MNIFTSWYTWHVPQFHKLVFWRPFHEAPGKARRARPKLCGLRHLSPSQHPCTWKQHTLGKGPCESQVCTTSAARLHSITVNGLLWSRSLPQQRGCFTWKWNRPSIHILYMNRGTSARFAPTAVPLVQLDPEAQQKPAQLLHPPASSWRFWDAHRERQISSLR